MGDPQKWMVWHYYFNDYTYIYMVFSIVSTIIVDYYIIYLHIILGNPILTWRIWRYPHDVGTFRWENPWGFCGWFQFWGCLEALKHGKMGKHMEFMAIMGKSWEHPMINGCCWEVIIYRDVLLAHLGADFIQFGVCPGGLLGIEKGILYDFSPNIFH